jgi:hypothetical protein
MIASGVSNKCAAAWHTLPLRSTRDARVLLGRPFGAEQPPTFLLLPCRSGLTFKVDFHRRAGVGQHFKPVLAHVPIAAAVMARAGLPPRLEHARNAYDLRSPPELPRQPRLAGGHPARVDRFNDRLNRFADEFLGHGDVPAWSDDAKFSAFVPIV